MWQLPQNLLGLLLLSVLKWEGATRVCDPREHFREPTKKGGDRHSNRLPTFVIFSIFPCGEIGIRTRDTILSYTRFPGVPLKPLEHLSCNFRPELWEKRSETDCKGNKISRMLPKFLSI